MTIETNILDTTLTDTKNKAKFCQMKPYTFYISCNNLYIKCVFYLTSDLIIHENWQSINNANRKTQDALSINRYTLE